MRRSSKHRPSHLARGRTPAPDIQVVHIDGRLSSDYALGQSSRFVADPEDAAATDEQVADSERLWRAKVRVANQSERHGRITYQASVKWVRLFNLKR
jgi:hypothetical protein